MAIKEVFPNPTVKQVIFQIRFPNLFYLESRIGNFQLDIMDILPESGVAYRRLVFGDIGPDAKLDEIPKSEQGGTIWQFYTPAKDVQLNLTSNSLDITSTSHKTYNLEGGSKFRNIIEHVITKFLTIVSIPVINRIGLRYIDECPLPSKDTITLKSYYNSVFPYDRFNIEDTDEMVFRIATKTSNHRLQYIEAVRKIRDSYKLILDFDGSADNIPSKDLMTVLDKLHESISNEYEKTIKGPVYEYMRKITGVKDG